jgi:hypothetical protein
MTMPHYFISTILEIFEVCSFLLRVGAFCPPHFYTWSCESGLDWSPLFRGLFGGYERSAAFQDIFGCICVCAYLSTHAYMYTCLADADVDGDAIVIANQEMYINSWVTKY